MRIRSTVALAALFGLVACVEQPTDPGSTSRASGASPSDPTPASITLEKIGGFAGSGLGAGEINSFDHVSKRLFVVNSILSTVDVLDMQDPSNPVKIGQLPITQFGPSANSVDARNGVVAVAIEAAPKTSPGTVAFFRATTLELISSVTVGALPDMLAFTPSGDQVVVANEGEPSDDYTSDPEGTVSIIDVKNINLPTVRSAGFAAFNGSATQLRASGIRIYGPNASVAQDLEPEYIAVSDDSRTAYVTLQENNALGVIDLASATVTNLIPLGYKDHRLAANKLDVSDRDGVVNIANWPIFGMYQPDAIAAYTVDGQTYLVTANEGDSREWTAFNEQARVSTLTLEPTIFTDAVCGGPCSANTRLGRLNVTNALGKNPSTGRYDALYAFGARSFSIRTASGALVYDSGDDLEQRTKALGVAPFNASHDNNNFDDRSDNKGPEPEGVVLGKLGAKTFAFIGLERIGGVMVYDVSNPFSPKFETYLNTRNGSSGDLGPEGLTFVNAVRSPSKEPLLIVGNEISGTTAVYQIHLH